MKIIVCDDYKALSKAAYDELKPALKPGATLALATGSSPIGLYDLMAEDYEKGNVSYRDISSVNLDEYVGLGAGDEQSYYEFMRKNLFDRIDIDKNRTDLPNGKAADIPTEIARYEAKLERTSVDVQILGIGSNGHIGFNEPGTPFDSVVHLVDLTENTIKDNARFFISLDEVPRHAISMGIKNVMHAKKIILLANGKNKALAVRAMIEGGISTECPASVLQLHPDCTVVLDKEAASLLGETGKQTA